jgi:8-oxo-dGTP pyrophosphatase MutT (NUDIX family)
MYCCTNCGCNTHTHGKCYHPCISIGIIAYIENKYNEIEYLMVKRKNTYGYVDFIRGKYSVNDIIYIKGLFEIMTVQEREHIQNHTFDELWKGLWNNTHDARFKSEYTKSYEKFNLITSGIKCDDGRIDTLSSILSNIRSRWVEEEWGFPKGRRNSQESSINCAIREFSEETGYDKNYIDLLTNVVPFDEIFTGTDGKIYKNIYYVGTYNGKDISNIDRFQRSEISDMRWINERDICDILRPYDNKKNDIIKKISTMLKENRIITHYI